MCNEQFANMGVLLKLYKTNTDPVTKFFDLQVLRMEQQVLFDLKIKINNARTVVKHKLIATDRVKLENPGVTELKIYLAATKGALPGLVFVRLPAGQQITVNAPDLGLLSNTYLIVYNADLINKGHIIVNFL